MLRQKYLALAEDKSPKSEVVSAGFFSQAPANLLLPHPKATLVRSHSLVDLSSFLPPEAKRPLEEEISPLSQADSFASLSSDSSELEELTPDQFPQEPPLAFTSWFGSGLWQRGPSVMRFSTHKEQKKKAYLKNEHRSANNLIQRKSLGAASSEEEVAQKNHRAFTFFTAEVVESDKIPNTRPTFCQSPASYPSLRDNDGQKLELVLPQVIKAKFR